MFDVSRRSTDVGLVLPPALAPRDVRVRPVVPDQVPPGLGDVHDHSGQELGLVEGLGRIARLPGAAVVPSLASWPRDLKTPPTAVLAWSRTKRTSYPLLAR